LETHPPSNQNIVRYFCILVRLAMGGWIFKRRQRRRVANEIYTFVRQLSTILNEEVSVSDCLEILKEQSHSHVFRNILAKLRSDIDSGMSLSAAVNKHRPVFSDLCVCLIEEGESSGCLTQNLGVLADFLQGTERIQSNVSESIIFCGKMFAICVVPVMGLFVLILPQFKEAFMYSFLSEGTKLVLGISNILVPWWYLILTVLVGLGFLVFPVLDYLLGMPIRTYILATLARNLSIQTALGVPLISALEVATKHSGGNIKTANIVSTSQQLNHEPIVLSDSLPVEDALQISKKLVQISNSCGSEVEKDLERLKTLIEAGALFLEALIVSIIVLTVFRPYGGILFGNWW